MQVFRTTIAVGHILQGTWALGPGSGAAYLYLEASRGPGVSDNHCSARHFRRYLGFRARFRARLSLFKGQQGSRCFGRPLQWTTFFPAPQLWGEDQGSPISLQRPTGVQVFRTFLKVPGLCGQDQGPPISI